MTPRRTSKKSQPNTSDGKVPSDNQQDNQNELFPVVGIGASAGGLEAFTELLNSLPTDTCMAFVMIEHMPPKSESMLNLILGRATQMPVHEVLDGMAVAPNQVYVIPPNASLTIAQGVLKLKPRPRANTPFMSVDTFLLSLAEDRGNKAIGVILSGADSDGARGLEAIKAAGGVTFAQCQESAQVDSMPNTAIATGQVDFILPPDKIAQKLAEISCHPYIVNLPATESLILLPAGREDAIAVIFDLLRKATGV